ncbi:MAG TPA: Arc family DNA-binding protein [Kofleriaceae bacterium]
MAKTTLDLPADLLRRVKARAAEQGRSMESLINEALENALRQAEPPAAGWRAVFGRAKPGSTRDVDRFVKELRRVDPRDWGRQRTATAAKTPQC